MPTHAAATTSAPSVGSPIARYTSGSLSSRCSMASLQRAPAISKRSRFGCNLASCGRGVGDRETEPGALRPLRELHPAGGHVEGGDRHAVLGQRPGLVRADHLDRPKSLDGWQPADEGAPLEHALRAQRERDRDHGGQGLRNGCHGQTDRNEHHFPPGLTPHHAEHEDRHYEHQRGRGQLPTELVQALLQWRRLLCDRLEQAGDLAQLRRHAGCGDDSLAMAIADDRARINHVAPVAEGASGGEDHTGVLLHRLRLAGQGRFLHAQRTAPQEACVRWYDVAGLQQYDITWHELAGRDLQNLAVAADSHQGGGHALQRRHGLLGPMLLEEPKCGVEHDDGQDGARVEQVSEKHRQDRGRKQDKGKHTGELRQEQMPGVPAAGVRNLVRPVLIEPLSRLGFRQTRDGGVPRRAAASSRRRGTSR